MIQSQMLRLKAEWLSASPAGSAALIPGPQYVFKSFRIHKLKGTSIFLREKLKMSI